MDLIDAQRKAQTLVGSLTIPDEVWALAGEQSLTIDGAGRRPGDADYTDSYDAHWLAAEAVTIVAVQSMAEGGVEQFTSEGATFKFATPDLHRMAAMLRSQSGLSKIAGGALGALYLDGSLSDYQPRSGGRAKPKRLSNGIIVPERMDWT